MDAESEFLSGLIELQYGLDVEEKLKKVAPDVEWAQGWPENKKAFWNAEAFMWSRKISKEKRELIYQELLFLEKGKNLDIGCGAYSYIKSIGFDVSTKMLQFNDDLTERVQGELEEKLPFSNFEFDSITAVFVLNYVINYHQLLLEVGRILKDKGKFVMVLFSKQINNWQKQKQINNFSAEKWQEVLIGSGLSVKSYEKGELWFFNCSK